MMWGLWICGRRCWYPALIPSVLTIPALRVLAAPSHKCLWLCLRPCLRPSLVVPCVAKAWCAGELVLCRDGGAWKVNIPAATPRMGQPWGTLYSIPRGPQQEWAPVAHNGDLLINIPSLGFLPFHTPLLVLRGITSQVNFLYLNPCLRVCFGGTQSKT